MNGGEINLLWYTICSIKTFFKLELLLFEYHWNWNKHHLISGSAFQEEMKDPLTSHPRFVRYLGTCFNPSKLEAYVITDYAVGCTLEDIMKNPEVREAMDMTEEGKVRAAADLADAVYFLHGHSKPVAHGAISTANVVVDGETHRGKLVARQGAERIQQLVTLKGRPAVVMSITISYSIRIFIRFNEGSRSDDVRVRSFFYAGNGIHPNLIFVFS